MLKRILVATDFSVNADHAWGSALDLARQANAELLLLHVKPPLTSDRNARGTTRSGATRGRGSSVARPANSDGHIQGRPREGRPKNGLAPDVITATALDEQVDVVVVGTHGRDAAAGILVRSVGGV
jgi:nucleotide-binding universal stress UspA family protein